MLEFLDFRFDFWDFDASLISSLYSMCFQKLESCICIAYGQFLKHIFWSAGHFWPLFDRMKITSETPLNYHREFQKNLTGVHISRGGSTFVYIGEKKFTCVLHWKLNILGQKKNILRKFTLEIISDLKSWMSEF